MPKPPITDSPWLWFTLFTAVGLTALLATGGKFRDRQADIEREGQAQSAIAQGLEITEDASGKKTATGVPRYSAPGETEIRLVPLAITIGGLCVASAVMLVRELVFVQKGDMQLFADGGTSENQSTDKK